MELKLTDKQLNRLANGREYRAMKMECREGEDTRMVVEGYACTFGQAYDLYDSADYKITEQIDARAFDGCDMSDVIMQYDHEGRVFARQSNKTLLLIPDHRGLLIAADLGKTDLARGLYQDIEAGMITKMSWAFRVQEES